MRAVTRRCLARLAALAVLAGLALPASCAAPFRRDDNDLAESIRRFNDGVRWERFAAAATAIPPAARAQFVDDMDQRAGDVKITDYDIVKVDARGEREAEVHIKVSWYRASEGTLHETHAVQTWERHGKLWWMVDETRLRGAEMPGLIEPSRGATTPPPGAPAASASAAVPAAEPDAPAGPTERTVTRPRDPARAGVPGMRD